MAVEKTNVMRILDQKKIPYTGHSYPVGDTAPDGLTVARLTGLDPDTVFKTLVTVGASKKNYVFVIPVGRELDLKAAARAVREKSIAMIKQSELLPLTGYVHGGCSPVGMKKAFPTVIDSSAQGLDAMTVSAGKVGCQVRLAPDALAKLVRAGFFDVCTQPEESL